MRVVLLGPESDSFLAALKSGGIAYRKQRQDVPIGVPMNADGDIINILVDAVPWASIAAVMVAWLRALSSRKITVTTKDKEILHTEGLGAAQVCELLKRADEVYVVDIHEETTREKQQIAGPDGSAPPPMGAGAEPENGEGG